MHIALLKDKLNCTKQNSTLILQMISEMALLTHVGRSPCRRLEHQAISIPQGNWMVRIQREYEFEGWRYVAD